MSAISPSTGLVDPKVFEDLQNKIDDDTKTRDQIRDIVQALEKQERPILSTLANAHSAANNDSKAAVREVENRMMPAMLEEMSALSSIASQQPYYKFNHMWSRQMQDACFAVVLCGWLGGFGRNDEGQLLTIEQVGEILNVPVNLKDRDAFHLSIEEYLHSLISLIDELARLARNSVTLGNYQRPLLISQFVKDLHAGFQILNLKNDNLRRRNDSIKYKVREVEDVVYDLSLRNLLPQAKADSAMQT